MPKCSWLVISVIELNLFSNRSLLLFVVVAVVVGAYKQMLKQVLEIERKGERENSLQAGFRFAEFNAQFSRVSL